MKKIVVVRSRQSAVRGLSNFDLHIPVNVKVKGERTMMKNVRLVPVPENADCVKVLTGRRGRPTVLPVSQIERVRAL